MESISVKDKSLIFNTDLVETLEFDNLIRQAIVTMDSAYERKESRGAQSRLDYPERDDENWLKHILVKNTENGPELSTSEVSITQWTPVERTY